MDRIELLKPTPLNFLFSRTNVTELLYKNSLIGLFGPSRMETPHEVEMKELTS